MRLERFGTEDGGMYRALVFNEEAMRMNFGRVFTEEEADMVFRAMLETNAECDVLGFFKVYIEKEAGEEFIGIGSVSPDGEGGAEIEYMLLPDFWGHGYGTRLVGELIKISARANIKRVTAYTDPQNSRSRSVLLKNGFIFKENMLNCDEEPVDVYVLS